MFERAAMKTSLNFPKKSSCNKCSFLAPIIPVLTTSFLGFKPFSKSIA